jgi:hypothetical protein
VLFYFEERKARYRGRKQIRKKGKRNREAGS